MVACSGALAARPGTTRCTACQPNGAECCKAKTCGDRDAKGTKVLCSASLFELPAATKCTTCVDNGEACCATTCADRDRAGTAVECGAGFAAKPAATQCAACETNGDECCFATTCGRRDAKGRKAKCSNGLLAQPAETKCTVCRDNGDECCIVKTCGEHATMVVCPEGLAPDSLAECATCDSSECCTTKTCGNPDGERSNVTCGDGLVPFDGATECEACANDGEECCAPTADAMFGDKPPRKQKGGGWDWTVMGVALVASVIGGVCMGVAAFLLRRSSSAAVVPTPTVVQSPSADQTTDQTNDDHVMMATVVPAEYDFNVGAIRDPANDQTIAQAMYVPDITTGEGEDVLRMVANDGTAAGTRPNNPGLDTFESNRRAEVREKVGRASRSQRSAALCFAKVSAECWIRSETKSSGLV